MKHLTILLLSLLLAFSASTQTSYKWNLSIGSGTLFYIGDVGNKKMSRLSPSLQLAIERRFSHGLAARARTEFGHISANDRTNAFNKVNMANPNFNRDLNFRSKITNAYIELMYYTNNGYIFKEDAFISPFAFAGVGLSNFRVFADQFYGPANSQKYNYADEDGNVRNIPSGDTKVQDGNFETDITKKPLEGKRAPNTAFAMPLGAGVHLRFSDRWNAQISAAMSNPFTDYLDGVSGKYVAQTDPTLAYLANPNNMPIGSNRGNNSKSDNIISTSFHVNYNFGANFLDKGPIVYADSSRKKKTKIEVYTIDPFDVKTSNAVKPMKNYILKENEEMVFYTNSRGQRDTMVVMRMDTIYRNAFADNSEVMMARAGGNDPQEGVAPKVNPTPKVTTTNPQGVPTTTNPNYGQPRSLAPKYPADVPYHRESRYADQPQTPYNNNGLVTKPATTNTTPKPAITTTASYAQVDKKVVEAPKPASVMRGAAINSPASYQKVKVEFELNLASLDPSDLTKLNGVVDVLKKNPSMGVTINSYSDLVGVVSTNMKLAQERAANIRKYLESKGVSADQMVVRYHGSEERVGSLDPSKRRAEIEFIKVK